MSMPPEFLRSMLDGASDASFLVLSSGVIWHINEAARRMFNVVDGKGNSVSTYLSFCTTHSPGRETLRLTWQDVASPDSFVDDRKSVDGIGMRPRNGDRFPITISSVKISNCPRSSAGGQHTPSEQIGESDDEDFFYCLYIHDITPARLQLASLEEEVNRLSATKDAVIRASGQSLVVADSTGYIKSVSSGLFDMFGYEQGDQVIRQPLGLLLKENSCDLSLNDESRREVQGKLKNGGGIDLEIGISKICPSLKNRGYTAIMIKNITQRKENERRESLNDRISRGLRERSNILDAAFDPMFCTNKTGIIFMVNQAAVDQFGWSRGELIGQNVSMIVGGVHRHRHDSYMKRYMETGEKRMIGKQREIRAIRKNGTEFEAELGLAEISRAGEDTLFCGFIRDITQQKAYERKISDQVKAEQEISRELLNNQSIILGILDASFHALFVINEQCIIQKVNKMSCDVFGWKEEEFIGNNISMIMTKDVGSNHDQYITRYLETGMKKMIGTQREVTACRKDGSTFLCKLGLSETQDSGLLCGFIRDITSEKAAEAELIQERTLLTKILNASFDALLVINERGIIQKVNTASTRVFGWTEEEFLGKNINMIMPSEHAKRHDSYLERYIATGFKRMIGTEREVEARKKNGALFPCILGLTEVFHNGSRQFVGFIKDVTVQKSLLIVEAERQASDTLLHNILPENIARRLKQDPSHIADHYDNTTILFADIVGFTAQTSLMSPHDVVTMLNDLFSRFDHLVGRYDLNKVKTIGDCYMVTSIPSDELEHDGCSRVCRFALDLLKAVKEFNNTGPQHGHIALRVGIATGQVVAGVVGTKRFLFDMWGDAVNVAARMEQHGVPGHIQVTEEVVDKAGHDFSFEFRGTLNVKGKGAMDAYFLKSARDVSSRRSIKEHWADVPPKPARCRSTLM